MGQPQSPPLEELLAEVHWIRALSRQLVRDPDLADEVVQQTLVRATTDGPREAASLRAWLGAVVRNFARTGLRSRTRRRHHEQLAARPEGLPSTHDVVVRATLQRELVECVMELDEPYRTTLLLRFYESHSPREIARTLGVPPATVRTRLARGLALLRAKLDRKHGGDRSAWALIAVPLRKASLSPLAPLVAMNLKATLAASALCAACVVWFLAIDAQPTQPDPQVLAAAPKTPAVDLEQPLKDELQAAGAPTRAAREPQPAQAVAATTDDVNTALVRGRVLDVDSRPVALVPILFVPESGEASTLIATSDASGNFSMQRPTRPTRASRLEVDDERWCTVFAGLIGNQADQRICTIIVAPNAPLSGVVVDDAGVPLADVDVSVQPQFSLRTRFAESLDSSEDVMARLKTDSSGRFEFARLPRCQGLRLAADLGGHIPYSAPFADTDRPFKTITLARTSSTADVVRGRVVDEGDLPIAKAVVALGLETTLSDEHGEFAIAKKGPEYRSLKGDPIELRALAPGRLPASFSPPMVGGEAQWPEFVSLRLGGKPLSLRGRVVRADGTPLPNVRVWLDDSTTFGSGPGGTLQLEGWLAGDTENAWHYATSAADGSFQLDGLLEREYKVCALDAASLERETLERVAAGKSDVVVRFAEDNCWAKLEGTVVDSEGRPLSEVRVVPRAMGFMARYAGRNMFSTSMSLDGVVTDSAGRFALERLPREGVSLEFGGDHVLDRSLTPDPATFGDGPTPNLRVVLERRMQLQIELADPSSADQFALLDATDHEISMRLRTGTTTYFMIRAPIIDGHSHVASAGESARSVVLYKGDSEVGRIKVQLSAEEITVVRL